MSPPSLDRAPVLGLALALAACGPPDAAAPGGEVPRWTLAEDLRYPADERAPLTTVRLLAPAPDGRIYVGDARGGPRVLAFGPDGAFERAFGGEGDGPGELRNLWQIGVAGDTLWVIDARLDRLSLFSPNGSFLGSTDVLREVELPDSLRSVTVFGRMGDGSLLIVAAPPLAVQTPAGPRSADEIFVFRAAPGAGAAPVDTLDTRHHTWEVRLGSRGGRLFTRQPFSDAELLEPSPYGDGWAIVEQPQPASADVGTYAVERFGPEGRSRYRAEVRYPPARMEEEDARAALAIYDEAVDDFVERGLFASAEQGRERFAEALHRPEYLSPVTSRGQGLATESVRIDDGGRVWIERRPGTVAAGPGLAGSASGGGDPPGDEAEPSVWDVVGPEGPIARVVVPAGVTLLAVRGDLAWGVATDALDVPTIVRYRIAR